MLTQAAFLKLMDLGTKKKALYAVLKNAHRQMLAHGSVADDNAFEWLLLNTDFYYTGPKIFVSSGLAKSPHYPS